MMAVDNGIPTTIEKANGEGGELEEGEIVGNSAMGEAEPRQGAEGEDEDGDAGEQDDCGSQRKQVEIHPLEHSWTFWFDNHVGKSKQVAWGSTIRAVYTFSTAEDFWGVYNNINHPNKLPIGADFHCFKLGIEPKWEDPICANGGKWTLSCSKGKVDNLWLNTLLAMIGEQFDHGDEICGAVVNLRAKQEKISIWTKDGLNEAAQTSIGRQWKEHLDYNEPIGFILHDDAKKQDRFAKSRYTV
ncbi:eukaryotic translation initiation factor 4E-1-like [Zingiber officinale]|uniref:eukaryotic translation initiation factor 4E-1-like n=1 Tax=Zingiber officinale TaxID=94328 RepID=UPI001C4D64F6|nr:eukaryotic translation initiation factor 4E-1-like [Zingiber officinale]XP_042382194.1 eukaryotic translation initiation factor 4E-1-like [Zingiber officinale]